MPYSVTCECGIVHSVSASQAGTELLCECERMVQVPLMSTLRRLERDKSVLTNRKEQNEFSESPPPNEVSRFESKEKLRRIAERQRDLNVAILLSIGIAAAYVVVPISGINEYLHAWKWWFLAIALVVGAIQAVAALRCASELARDIGLPILAAAVQFAPSASLLVMGIDNRPSLVSNSFFSSAVGSMVAMAIVSFFGHTRLEKNGLKPGMMGVNPKTI